MENIRMSDEVKVIQVIYCSKKRKGQGIVFDPIRIIEEIFDLDGNLIFDYDPEKRFTEKDLFDITARCGIDAEIIAQHLNEMNKK